MNLPWRLKLLAGRARRRRAGEGPDREDVVRRYASGRSFCDVGCMWKVNGRLSFVAEEAGATNVTGVDIAKASPEFDAEHKRRDSRVRFVHGDLHDPAVIDETGRHDVVWCSGVLYHSPNPVTTLRRLRELTGERLILQTTCVPELPGVRQGMVFYPGLEEGERSLYGMWGPDAARSIGPVEGWDDEFGPWWWGITPSALRAMMRSAGLEPIEEWGDPFGIHVVARPV